MQERTGAQSGAQPGARPEDDRSSGADDDPGRTWMLEFQRGDDAAFRSLVLHYGERVAAFFRRAGADRASAEDLAQEAFLRIARARDRYEPTAKFSTWLHRILFRMAMNEGSRNRWRRALPFQSGRESGEREPGLPEPGAPPEADPSERASIAELKAHVRAAVAGLPEPQRTALLLHRFEGCSCEEVGAALGLSVPAVKSLLFRARDNVRQRLAPLLGEEFGGEGGAARATRRPRSGGPEVPGGEP